MTKAWQDKWFSVHRLVYAPLELLLVRKIGAPGHRELAVAAVAEGAQPAIVIDHETLDLTETREAYVEREAKQELRKIARSRRRTAYVHDRAPLQVAGRTVIVVNDGIATGTTVRAALLALRRRRPARLVLALPVATQGCRGDARRCG